MKQLPTKMVIIMLKRVIIILDFITKARKRKKKTQQQRRRNLRNNIQGTIHTVIIVKRNLAMLSSGKSECWRVAESTKTTKH